MRQYTTNEPDALLHSLLSRPIRRWMGCCMSIRKPTRLIATMLVMLGIMVAMPAIALGDEHDHDDDDWTSMWVIPVSGDEAPEGGEPGASGTFSLWFNSDTDTVYYEIELMGVTPPYDSPALTATHIHEGAPGEVGPPRVVFDDPQPQDDGTLWSSGTVQGPFITGAEDDEGNDEGDGFTLSQIEANPGDFYVDTHTEEYPMGAARGQFGEPAPSLPATGGGGAAESGSLSIASIAIAASAAIAAAGVFGWGVIRRRPA